MLTKFQGVLDESSEHSKPLWLRFQWIIIVRELFQSPHVGDRCRKAFKFVAIEHERLEAKQ